jgi:hypothetical protein
MVMQLCAMAIAALLAIERPIYPAQGETSTYVKRIAPLMALSEVDMVALVPAVNGMMFVGCPNCDGGTQDGQMDWNGIDDPWRVHCRYCKMVFPNDQYPMDQSITVINRAGEEETWRYHERDGDQYYFAARARYFAKMYMADRTRDLAQIYALSGDEQYARRAVLLLARFAGVFPQWCVMQDYPGPGKKYPVSDAKPPYPYWGGIWNRWHLYDTPTPIAFALDLVWDSEALKQVSGELGIDVRQRVADDLLRADIDFQRHYTAEMEPYNGVAPQRSAGFILVGRVIGEPDFVHDGVERIRHFVSTDFYADGMHRMGTVAYHRQMVNNVLIAADYARDYSDPPDYVAPRNGERFEDLDLLSKVPLLGRADRVDLWFVFPNGHTVCTHDAWATHVNRPTDKVDQPVLLPHYGHGRLTLGQGADAMQAHLHYSAANSHAHADDLSLILFAHSQEVMPDIGYTHTRWRLWPSSTAAHNTVAVNRQDHKSSIDRTGNLQLYDVSDPIVRVIEATQLDAAPSVVDEFRRRLILVRVDDADSYVIDVFRLRGGTRHDYFLHGSADLPQTARLSVPLSPIAGTLLGPEAKFRLPQRETDPGEAPEGQTLSYAMFRDLQAADIAGPISATWRFDDAHITTGLRSHLLHPGDGRIVLAQTPQIRPVQTWPAKEDDSKLDQYWRPSVVIERQADQPLTSVFIAVHEPFDGEPFITDIDASVQGDDVHAPVRLTVHHASGVDRIETRPDGTVVRFERQANDEVSHRYALTAARFAGEVRTAHDHAIVVTGDIPPGDALRGRTAVVTFGDGRTLGLPIDRVEREGDTRVLRLRADPGFKITDCGAKLLYFPLHDIQGPVAYRIAAE